jgi:hypothetical protein
MMKDCIFLSCESFLTSLFYSFVSNKLFRQFISAFPDNRLLTNNDKVSNSSTFFVRKCFSLVTFWQQKALLYEKCIRKMLMKLTEARSLLKIYRIYRCIYLGCCKQGKLFQLHHSVVNTCINGCGNFDLLW